MSNRLESTTAQTSYDLASISLPTNATPWSPMAAPQNLCLKPEPFHLANHRPSSFSTKIIKELEKAILDVSIVSGYSLQERFKSTLNYYIAGQPSKTNPDRQTQTALILAHLIKNLNKSGITPKLLEIGAGPSFSQHNDYNFQPPWTSRLLSVMNKRELLHAQLFCADPALMPQIEASYGIKAFNAKIDTRPDTTIGQLSDILINNDGHDFLLHLHQRGSQSFIEGYLIDLFHEHMQRQLDPMVVDTRQPIFISYPVNTLLLTAQTWFNSKSFPATYNECEMAYGEHLLGRLNTAATHAKHPAPEISKEIMMQAPFDVIFGQQLPLAPSRFLPLVANGGRIYQFPDCNSDPKLYAKQVWHTAA